MSGLQVVVLLPDGAAEVVNVTVTTLVSDVKVTVADEQELLPGYFDLHFVGQLLDNDRRIVDYGVTSACNELEVQLSPRGAAIRTIGKVPTPRDFRLLIERGGRISQHLLAGLSVNEDLGMGSTPLIVATKFGHAHIVKQLLQHPDIEINKQTLCGASALYMASELGRTDIAKQLLLLSDIEPNLGMKNKSTALIAACEGGHADIVRLLLSHPRVNVDEKMCSEAVPLHYAVLHNHLNVVEVLLEQTKSCVGQPNSEGITCLGSACEQGNLDAVRMMLSLPESLPALHSQTCSPLHIAASNGHFQIVKHLVQIAGVDIHIENSSGVTSEVVAKNNGYFEIYKFLRKVRLDKKKGPLASLKRAFGCLSA